MEARELQDMLVELLEELIDARDDEDDPIADLAQETEGISRVCTFDDAGLLSGNKGLVIELDDGSEFQVSIVQSA